MSTLDDYTIISGIGDKYGYILGFSNKEIKSFPIEKKKNVKKEKSEDPLRPKAIFYNPPLTHVFWNDGTSTKVCTHNEPFTKEFGYAMALARKIYGGNRSEFLRDVESGYSHTDNPTVINHKNHI